MWPFAYGSVYFIKTVKKVAVGISLFVGSVVTQASNALVNAPNFIDSQGFYIIQFSCFFVFLKAAVPAEEGGTRSFRMVECSIP